LNEENIDLLQFNENYNEFKEIFENTSYSKEKTDDYYKSRELYIKAIIIKLSKANQEE
jgi:hypothetical protein